MADATAVMENEEQSLQGHIEGLLQTYNEQPLLHQRIMQIRALSFYTTRKTDFTNCIMKTGLVTEDNKKLNSQNLNSILQALFSEDLLTEDYNCNPDIIHELSQIAVDDRNPHAKSNITIVNSFIHIDQYNLRQMEEQILRKAHIAMHTNDATFFLSEKMKNVSEYDLMMRALTQVIYMDIVDMNWVKTRHPIIQAFLCGIKLQGYFTGFFAMSPDVLDWVLFYVSLNQNSSFVSILDSVPLLQSRFLQFDVSMGLIDQAKQKCRALSDQHFCQQETLGTLAFFDGDYVSAAQYYDNARKQFKQLFREDTWFAANLHGVFYILALIHQENFQMALATIAHLRSKKLNIFGVLPDILEVILQLKRGDRTHAEEKCYSVCREIKPYVETIPMMHALVAWTSFLLDPQILKKKNSYAEYEKQFFDYSELHHYVAAQLYAEIMLAEDEDDPRCLDFFETISPYGSFRFLNLVPVKQPWEYAIDQLQKVILAKPENSQVAVLQDKRLVWFVDPDNVSIHIAEQKCRKNGKWTDGKAVALKRLYHGDSSLNYLTNQDVTAIKQGLRCEVHGWYNQEEYSWDDRHTLKALLGHPLVLHAKNPEIHIELVQGEVELQVEKKEKGYFLSLAHHSKHPRIFLEKETANRYRVIDFSEEAVAISNIISERGLMVPVNAKEKVLEIVQNAKSNIRIHSDIEEDNLLAIAGNTNCCIHLLPVRDGLKINIWIRPFEDQGPYCRAGHGQASIISIVHSDNGDVRQKAIRNFEEEKNSVMTLLRHCPTLLELDEHSDEWHIESIEKCLEVLLELDEYKKNNQIHVEWPKGQTLKLKQAVSFDNLSLSIKGNQYWFEYDGQVQLDHNQALDMKNLLDLLQQDNGRFIKLADGEFIALAANFKKQLEELKAISEGNKIYHLGAGVLREIAEESGQIKVDKKWKLHLEKLQAMEKHHPAVPSTLQATLRDYQVEGFAYLSRLAHWGIGACLADDMGLGKTVQAIALLLEQAHLGPCIVVAPTSVCFIWMEELSKFAPTLNIHALNTSNERQSLIASLDKMDILICSYTLLHQAGDMLSKKDWQVAILDEAQAIKNPETKRWKNAMRLKSQCRIALTGTPIENHLGEIWSIFRFLNPGLLGSRESFRERYSAPIERSRDPIAKRALKNLVHPYILRRTKTEVLQELPPKTEQSILIEPTAEEMAFYEAVRMKALERIQQLDDSKNNTKRFSILAEITRLRQACCHSSLVDENVHLESSKINSFLTLVKNLIDNNHKVLVFSQYVRYLSKIREILDVENISYQYLDGSTPNPARQAAVADFQAGRGDLFLISLKAGGTGLNLTAADYVIILDPWWNPAVEDQASDRAHRMGQVRPVTVYRLIMKNSIEEKIIKLHKDKRDLASDLLSGSDVSGKISEEELIQLISA